MYGNAPEVAYLYSDYSEVPEYSDSQLTAATMVVQPTASGDGYSPTHGSRSDTPSVSEDGEAAFSEA